MVFEVVTKCYAYAVRADSGVEAAQKLEGEGFVETDDIIREDRYDKVTSREAMNEGEWYTSLGFGDPFDKQYGCAKCGKKWINNEETDSPSCPDCGATDCHKVGDL